MRRLKIRPAEAGSHRIIVAVLVTLGFAATAAAQGRVMGVVQDTNGRAIKGAIIRAQNPDTSSREWTAATDDKGRFVLLGLRLGPNWKFIAEAPGFFATEGVAPVRSTIGPPLTFNLRRDPGPIPGALVKDIQEQLQAARTLRDAGRYDQALAAYQSIHSRNPKLTHVNLVIAAVYRQKAEQEGDAAARHALLERASAAYDEVLKTDADNDHAKAELEAVRASLNDLK
jgi:tetratricopeptide (TPR) repeat protein